MTKIWIYIFFDKKIAIYLFLGFLKDIQGIRENFSPQKRTSSTSQKINLLPGQCCGTGTGTGTGTVGTVTFWLVEPEPEPEL